MSDTQAASQASAFPSPFDFQALAARAAAENPDAALLDVIEEDRETTSRWRRMWAQASVRKQERGAEAQRATIAAGEVRGRLVATRPMTMEGLVAKLKYAIAMGHDGGLNAMERATIRDALALLDPPQPKRRRRAAKRANGGGVQ